MAIQYSFLRIIYLKLKNNRVEKFTEMKDIFEIIRENTILILKNILR